MLRSFLMILFFGSVVYSREYRLCQPPSITQNACNQLRKGNSEVKCVSVSDDADCTIKMRNNEVDFGVFTHDDLFLAYQTYRDGIRLLYQLKHSQKQFDKYQTQMIAVVSTSFQETSNNINSLKNGGFCHPGFIDSQILNDRILKEFERKVCGNNCNKDLTDTENELVNLKKFFGKACRPGSWVANSTLNQILQKRYPELCSLCDNPQSCSYIDDSYHGHTGALKCVKDGRGKVAYVAASHVQDFMNENPSRVPHFQMMCPNGTVLPLNPNNPCFWIKRSWNVIASREEISDELINKLQNWLSPGGEEWIQALKGILLGKNLVHESLPTQLAKIGSYLGQDGGSLDPDDLKNPKCGQEIRWCTINQLETEKCQWISWAAAALGITPKITCISSTSTFECLENIKQNKADLMTIDSNYGYVARKLFSLSTVVYADNDHDQSNVVLAVIKNSLSSKFKSLEDLKGKKACFPEYGGISWMSFINSVRSNKLIPDSQSCDFKKVASDVFPEACAPGVMDTIHSRLQSSSKVNATALCAACYNQNCAANDDNIFFRDNGAFRCMEYSNGDIAFVKPKNLNDSTATSNQYEYRVLCKDGTLAPHTGLNVDLNCAWAVTIDSEVVSRRDISNVEHSNMALALLKLNKWLGSTADAPIKIYESFRNTKDLLFKDSTVGLETSLSEVDNVKAYKKLMMDAEACSSSALSLISLIVLLLSLVCNRLL